MTYSTDMGAAPRDGTRFVVLVPTGDADMPVSEEMASWDVGLERFEGEWRYVEAPWAAHDPIAWLSLPDIPDEIMSAAFREAA